QRGTEQLGPRPHRPVGDVVVQLVERRVPAASVAAGRRLGESVVLQDQDGAISRRPDLDLEDRRLLAGERPGEHEPARLVALTDLAGSPETTPPARRRVPVARRRAGAGRAGPPRPRPPRAGCAGGATSPAD